MIHFTLSNLEPRYLFLKFDNEEDEKWLRRSKDVKKQKSLNNHLNLTDKICFLKTYTGEEFTNDFLFEYIQPDGKKLYYCAIGLWQEVYKFFKKNNVAFDGLVENQIFFKRKLQHTFEEFKQIVDSWGLDRKPRPYQYEAAYKILEWYKSTSQLATRAGKTLIAYMIFRYLHEYMGAKKILMIVPAIDLVKQGYNDFKEYAEYFNTECIWAEGEIIESANLTIGTFQSLIKFLEKKVKDTKTKKWKDNPKYNPHFFDNYDVVFVDETHRASASQIKTIISQPFMLKTKIAFGMTGTLPKESTTERYCVHALLGAKIQEIKPKQLMDEGYISDIDITQYRLHYKDKEKQEKLFIKCAEYTLSFYETEKNPKNGNNEKILLDNPQFLIRHKKKLPEGIKEAKDEIYNGGSNIKKEKVKEDILLGYDLFGNEIKKTTKVEKETTLTPDEQYIECLHQMIDDSTTGNNLLVEKMMIHFMNERIKFLCEEILPKCDKNTLILATHTEYINYFADIVKKYFPNKHIDVITGSIRPKKREQIKNMLKENNDCILIASYGVMSTGITLSNLCYGVLFESYKSNTINMQSLGRGLGLSELKDKYRVFDIIDCFNENISNKIFLQGVEKIKIYKRENYTFSIINKDL